MGKTLYEISEEIAAIERPEFSMGWGLDERHLYEVKLRDGTCFWWEAVNVDSGEDDWETEEWLDCWRDEYAQVCEKAKLETETEEPDVGCFIEPEDGWPELWRPGVLMPPSMYIIVLELRLRKLEEGV